MHKDPGAHELPAHGQALEHTEEDEEDGRGAADLGVRREAALYAVRCDWDGSYEKFVTLYDME